MTFEATSGCDWRNSPPAAAFSTMTRHPQWSVSSPWRNRNALIGLRSRPRSRKACRPERPQMYHVGAVRFVEPESVVVGVGDGERRDRTTAVRPVETALVDNDAADARAVAADELRGRVKHDVRAPLDRAAEKRRREGVVHDQRKVVIVRNGGDRFDVEQIARRGSRWSRRRTPWYWPARRPSTRLDRRDRPTSTPPTSCGGCV